MSARQADAQPPDESTAQAAPADAIPRHLGDFTVTSRTFYISLFACVIGAASGLIAWALLRLIGLITNLVFYQRFEVGLVAPGATHHPAALILLAPVLGGVLVGLMARYGSEAIRGHGMPEAIDAILRGGSKIKPRVALLKPISAAIAIGTGGPFGAEGPIIMTGGAFGSLLAQFFSFAADERKTLLVAGAAAGMAATFNAPLASLLLAVELLLFEWRPRSYLPVAAAVVMAAIVRVPLLGGQPIFPVPVQAPMLTPLEYLLCVLCGATGGFLALVATQLVYLSEDIFRKLPIHWMWWPAIGGLIVGVGGLIEPRALGVGYDVIDLLLTGGATLSLIVGILIVKTLIWSLSLGSGTSGGVLAPTFMIGAALGGLLSLVFPAVAPGFWPLVCLAAVVGGVMRSPLTGVIFALELTHDWPALLPLAISSSCAFGLSALLLKRSVLTEKVVRKGLHLTREYSIDPLEVLMVREVMQRDFISFRCGTPLREAAVGFASTQRHLRDVQNRQRVYPVLDEANLLAGIVTRRDMLGAALADDIPPETLIDSVMVQTPMVCYPDMTLREAAYLYAEKHVTRVPVVTRENPRKVIGMLTLVDLLEARLRDLQEERLQERVLSVRRIFRLSGGRLRIKD
ncbi:chloride channel protein [Pandoraea sp.]|uniref:chloride channel protein n=1 Tax=Pandoraea sp. TaxID=1883445 RepID=UPI001225EAEA|nr:chloride channel protein [Pandoraea sp.]TAL54550.1 MAG: CBS domain-containing protein [Pandoraea sp.]TAM15750.1 MAG: CBS domain-containing protein [Pandoraea sp.]